MPSNVSKVTLSRLALAIRARGFTAARWLVPVFIFPQLTAALWRARADVAHADVLIVYEGGGFGHQISGPDIIRRIFPGRAVTVLMGAFPGEDNMRVPLVWTSPRVHLISLSLKMPPNCEQRSLRLPVPLLNGFYKSLARFLALRYPDKEVISSYSEIVERLWAETERIGITIRAKLTGEIVEWILPYYRLMRQRSAPKGADIEIESSSRSGSEVTEYVQALRRLVAAGYQCLLIGDRKLSDEVAGMFDGWLIDAAALRVDGELFSLFAATDADIFIGELGGGSMLPGINGIPTLIVNHFPYFATRLRATVFPKFCYDADGHLIPPEVMFAANSHLHAIPGVTVRLSTAEELEIAVTEFISESRAGMPYGIEVENLVGSPNDLWYADAESRISPAWLALARRRQAALIAPG
jgi:putative glycosyltransferase (TIGR04372 family)